MVKNSKKEIVENAAEETAERIEPARVTIAREHCIEPHSVELRKNDAGLIVEARTEDWKHTYTVGAKTVAQIFAECGATIPANDTDQMEIVFSPHNGEVIAVLPKTLPANVEQIENPEE